MYTHTGQQYIVNGVLLEFNSRIFTKRNTETGRKQRYSGKDIKIDRNRDRENKKNKQKSVIERGRKQERKREQYIFYFE